eukprot:6201748-Pleurochrysis_carterae.AAC.1
MFEDPSGSLDIALAELTPEPVESTPAVPDEDEELASPTLVFETPTRPTAQRPPVAISPMDAPRQLLADKFPRKWYVIAGGPFEGIHYGSYELEISEEVEGYEGCRVYGPKRGVVDEASARDLLHAVVSARVRVQPHLQVQQATAAPQPTLPQAMTF